MIEQTMFNICLVIGGAIILFTIAALLGTQFSR